MTDIQSNFSSFEELNTHVQNEVSGFIRVTHRNCRDYEGMVLFIKIVFDIQQPKYELDLEWMSLGLDLFGETLAESYIYRFKDLESLFDYLRLEYNINVTDIPVKYEFDASKYPNPIKASSKKQIFENAWLRFQQDFKSGIFMDRSLKLVYSSDGS